MTARTDRHVVRYGADIVVLGTTEIKTAVAIAGLDTKTHQWDRSFAYRTGWTLHRDGSASWGHGARPAVRFSNVRVWAEGEAT